MYSTFVIVFLASAVKACAEELSVKHTTKIQNSTDKLVHKLVNKLFDRVVRMWPLQHTDMEDTMFAKGLNRLSLNEATSANLRPLPSVRSLILSPGQLPYNSRAPMSVRSSIVMSDITRHPSHFSKRETVLADLERAFENTVDDPLLANPMLRMQRLNPSWFGAIMEVDGVLLSDKSELQQKAWLQTAKELGTETPMLFELERAALSPNDIAVSDIFSWARQQDEVRNMSETKEAIFRKLVKDTPDAAQPGVQSFLEMLKAEDVPVAAVSTHSRDDVEAALVDAGLRNTITQVIGAEDYYDRFDSYNYAARLLERPPVRCVVMGMSNVQVESARDCGMKVVVIPPPDAPYYEFGAADLVLGDVSSITFATLRNLFAGDDANEPEPQLELEMETEPQRKGIALRWMDDDEEEDDRWDDSWSR